MNIGTAITGVNYVIRPGDVLCQQLVEHSNLSIASRCPDDRIDLACLLIAELGAKNVIVGNDALQRRIDNLHRRCRENVEIKKMSVNTGRQDLVEEFNVPFKPDTLAHFVQMLFSYFCLEFRIVEQ